MVGMKVGHGVIPLVPVHVDHYTVEGADPRHDMTIANVPGSAGQDWVEASSRVASAWASRVNDPVVISSSFSLRPAIAPRKSLTAPGVTAPLYCLHWKYTGNDTSDNRWANCVAMT